MEYSIGFIGCGNMGGAIADAVSKKVEGSYIYLSQRNEEKLLLKAKSLGANASNNIEIINKCKYIFLGVKPQMMEEVLHNLKDAITARRNNIILISMAAGLTTEKICFMAGGNVPVIRIMPNTPVAVGEGVVLYCCNDLVDEDTEKEFCEFMSPTGVIDKLDEKYIDAACSISGCGPAFAYMFIESLAQGAIKCGLPEEKAIVYASQMLVGSGKLLLQSKEDPKKLRQNVCSPGGSTIKGVESLFDNGFEKTVTDAVMASYKRNVELGNN